MLVALYRSGPLRQRLAKGYTVTGRSGDRDRDRDHLQTQASITAHLLSRPPRLPVLPTGSSLVLRGGRRSPTTLWIDTGRVVLHDTGTRSAVAAALAEAVAVVAEQVDRAGGLLMPSGWSPGGAGDPALGLCADLHSVEVVSDVQRELTCNLVREYSPALIALTGRQLHSADGVSTRGSARLSRATDQVATRYIASFSPQHLDRVRAGLRRSERLARLEAMDVNPLGEPDLDAHDDVTLRLFDAQLSVSSAMAHALLAQAISMRVRDLEREGRRVRSASQPMLERNRSQAVAHGLAAEFDAEQRPQGGRGGGRPTGSRTARSRPIPADRAVLDMLRELLPYFRQLDATADELAQLFLGLELTGGPTGASFVRNENDLLALWHEQDPGLLSADRLSRCLRSPEWLTTDHLSAANRERAAGSTAAGRMWLVGRLDPVRARQEERGGTARHDRGGRVPGQGNRNGRPSSADRKRAASGPALSDEQLLDTLSGATTDTDAVVEALRAYCRSAGALDLTRSLRNRGREEAKALRQMLRPRPAQRVTCQAPLSSWDEPVAERAVRSAAETGRALLRWDLPDAERPRVRAGLRALGRPPGDVRYVLLTDTAYTGKANERRGTVEVLLVAPAGEDHRKAAEEAAS
ncbi:hypothetical protein ACFYY3_32140 [Streptomyces sp. NPDC001812]|uniref:Uncharacterized protein n=1 Tax=Streptomyces cathayae TaxID=3031124 RepID=A0ABY8JZ82_9ACTN|nr:hypothetical protein [Streptomyces sp. HUAS 5]WGD39865.1 hypothetical protein PYS65_06810 [Streptomyces sp. HUAS 5]